MTMGYLVTFEVQLHDDDPAEAFRRAVQVVSEWIHEMPHDRPVALTMRGVPTSGVAGAPHGATMLDGHRLVYAIDEDEG